MADKLVPIKKLVPLSPEESPSVQERFRPNQETVALRVAKPHQPRELSAAQRRELPATLVNLEPKPLSAYDDNPVLDDIGAARFLGVSRKTLKKWRQRDQGPDYIQYGPNGPVRYELNALKEFRDKYRVKPRISMNAARRGVDKDL